MKNGTTKEAAAFFQGPHADMGMDIWLLSVDTRGSTIVAVQQPSPPDKTQELSGPLDCCGALSGGKGVVPLRVILQMEQNVCAN